MTLANLSGRTCAMCWRAVGPRNNHCRVCGPLVRATRLPCPEPECNNTRNHKMHRCDACQRARQHRASVERWQREKAKRSGVAA